MNRVFFAAPLLAIILFLASCGGGAEDLHANILSKLHGDWTMDLDASIAADPALEGNVTASDTKQGMARTMLGELTFSIDIKNSTISGSMSGSPLPLREFEIVAVQGNEVEIFTEGAVLRFTVTDDGMRLHAANGDVLFFKRR